MPVNKYLLFVAFCVLGWRAQSFTAEEVSVVNPVDSVTLNGTLTIPDGQVKAVAVMASGSGVQNRDEEIFGHRPFKAIAEHLANYGYAVFRFDDRGLGVAQPDSRITEATNDALCSDIKAVMVLASQRFPSAPIGVIGHSEGGTTAIKLASDTTASCDFIITLAAPAWPGDSVVMSQSRALSEAMTGRWDGEQTQRRLLQTAKGELPIASKKLYMLLELHGGINQPDGPNHYSPAVEEQLYAQITAMLSPWYVDMLRYDPTHDIKKVNIPWLALNGDRDLQVVSGNLETLATLNCNVQTVLLPRHNHLFLECSSGLPQEYPVLTGDISQATLEAITQWLNDRYDR